MTYQYIETTGVILADTADVQAQVEAEWKTALGADLVVTSDTPQGVLITQEVQARTNTINNNVAVANQLNPNIAGGIFLESICAWMGLYKNGASYTLVQGVALTGVAGTPIPAGVQVATDAGDIFASLGAVTLDGSGLGTVDFQAVQSGPIACLTGQLTHIQPNTAVLGWETVTNPNDGTVGQIEESDAALERQRLATLGAQGISSVVAQVSALKKVSGVTSLQFRENDTDATATIDGISLIARSVWACVAGGSDVNVATALLDNKTGGAGWNGATTVSVTEPASGQVYPVKFDRPTLVPVKTIITVSQGSSAADLTVTVPQTVIDFATGVLANEPGFTVGAAVSPFDLAAAIAIENPGVRVRSVQVALVSGGGYQTTEIVMALNQQATISLTHIETIVI